MTQFLRDCWDFLTMSHPWADAREREAYRRQLDLQQSAAACGWFEPISRGRGR